MSAVCPAGHESQTGDYCDQCGRPIGAAPAAAVPAPPAPPDPQEDEDTSPATRHDPCPVCAAHRSSDDRFCEACGYDFESPGNGAAWELVASASREQFERFARGGIDFPAGFTERRFLLDRPQVRIGRSREPGETKPDIDLAGSPEDPGISRLHVALERQPDGSYSIRDLGSTNGTTLNDDPQPIAADVAVPLAGGDRIRIGAWTTITLVAR
jgi:hypothetical protein